VKRHRRDEATAILGRLGNEEPEKLVAEIAESLHEETVAADEPFFQRKYRKPILLALMVATFNQLSASTPSSTTPPTSSPWPGRVARAPSCSP